MAKQNYKYSQYIGIILFIVLLGLVMLYAVNNGTKSPEQVYQDHLENQASEVQSELETIEYPRED